MLRRPAFLAALAHSAVPRLHPTAVSEVPFLPGDHYQSAVVTMDDGTLWDVKVALSPAAGAALESGDALTRLLRKRLPYAVPVIEGTTTTGQGELAAVLPHLSGTTTTWRSLKAGSDLARGLGKALAALHDVDPRVVDEAGLPTYDADEHRARKLAALDRAATTGHVPARLLGRWEHALEEVTLWRFATCTTHGPLESAHVLIDGDISAITGWEAAGVSDPADDFAPMFALAPTAAFDTVLEAYAAARRESPDRHLQRRITLAAELHRVTALMDAVGSGDDALVAERARALQRLDARTADDDSLLPSEPGRRRPAPAAAEEPVNPADIEVVDVRQSGEDDETVELPVAGPASGAPASGTPSPDAAQHGEPSSDTPRSDTTEHGDRDQIPSGPPPDEEPESRRG